MLDLRIAENDSHIQGMAPVNERARSLMKLSGVGATTASVIVATIGNRLEFKCGRQFSAWVGLTPSQHSAGGKAKLGGITKAGDRYLRHLLIQGARSMLITAKGKTDAVSRWAVKLQERQGYWREVVALAAKHARMCWALLDKGNVFRIPA